MATLSRRALPARWLIGLLAVAILLNYIETYRRPSTMALAA